MNREELKRWLLDNLIKNGKLKQSWKRTINYKNLSIWDELDKFENGKTWNEKIYLIVNDIYKIPKCLTCGNDVKFINFIVGYTRFCSSKCANRNQETKNKIQETNFKKYGTNYTLSNKSIRKKIKQTMLLKYGVENALQSEEIKEKTRQTCLKKYGVENPNQSKKIQEKIKQTCLKKYGTENVFQSKKVKEKIKQTCLKKYDVYWTSQINNAIKKRIKTSKAKQFDIFLKILERRKFKLISSKDEFLKNNLFKFKCLLCNEIFESNCLNANQITCKCRKSSISDKQKELSNWLKSLNIKVIENNRTQITPLELDLYLPDYKLAIEFNGLYWHSEPIKDKNYHLNKTNLCKEKEIQLIHIFENEWLNKQDIVKSIILAKLGIFNQRIMARKCQIKELSNEEYKNFVELNHIQGYVPAKYKIGLFYQDELVQICSFGKSRFKKGEIELIRHCSKLNTQIIGGLSKLLSYYKFDNLVTYVDLRYGNGNGYKNWKLIEQTKPNYWYWKYFSNEGYILESRMKYQKHKLVNLLENFDSNLSEYENMVNNGFTKIWDCGNLKLKYIKK